MPGVTQLHTNSNGGLSDEPHGPLANYGSSIDRRKEPA